MTADRAKLNFDDEDFAVPPPPPVAVEQIKTVTRKAGFHETPKAVAPAEHPGPRRRRKTGRTSQFATRLRPETIEAFHAYADRHEITIAETLERAQRALLESEKASS